MCIIDPVQLLWDNFNFHSAFCSAHVGASGQALILSLQEAAKDMLGRLHMVETEVKIDVSTFLPCEMFRHECYPMAWRHSCFVCFFPAGVAKKETNRLSSESEGALSPGWKSCGISGLSSKCCSASSSSLSRICAKCMKLNSANQL